MMYPWSLGRTRQANCIAGCSIHTQNGGAVSVPSFRLDGKVAVITGGSKGLGRAMALGFAEAGADVVVASRHEAACEEVASSIRSLGRQSLAVGCHVADWEQCELLVDQTISEFGRLDILVNNAGIAPVPPSLEGITEELFDKTVGVNLKGPLRLMGLAAEHIPVGGSVINISSIASVRPNPAHNRLRRRQSRLELGDPSRGPGARTERDPGERNRVRHVSHRLLRPLDPDNGTRRGDGSSHTSETDC